MDLNITPGAREADPYFDRTSVAQGAAGLTTIAPKTGSVGGQIHKLAGFHFSVDADGTYKFQSGTGNATATLSTAMAGANNDIKIDALVSGIEGNAFSFAITAPPDTNVAVPLSVSCTAAGVVVVTPEVDVDGSTILSTAAQVIAALNANATFASLMVASNAAANTGVGVVTAAVVASLASGTDTMTDLTGAIPCLAKVAITLPATEVPLVKATAGHKLCILTGTSKAFGVFTYFTEGS